MEEEEPSKELPQVKLQGNVSLFSRLTYSWTVGLIGKAQRQVLGVEDLGTVPAWAKTELSSERFGYFWRRAKRKGYGWWWIFFRMCRGDFIKATAISMCGEILLWIQPSILGHLIDAMSACQKGEATCPGAYSLYGLATMMLIVLLLRVFCTNYTASKMFDMAYIIRAAIMGVVYRRSLSFANAPRQRYCGGRGLNILASDTSQISTAITTANYVWIIPVRLLTAGIVVAIYGRWFALPGILFVCLVVPILYVVGRTMKRLQTRLSSVNDQRLELMQESLQSIRTIKYLALEDFAQERIAQTRKKELSLMTRNGGILSALTAMDFWAPSFAATLSVAAMVWYKNELHAATVFSIIQAFSALVVPLWMLPILVGSLITAKVSAKRLDAALQSEMLPLINPHRRPSQPNTGPDQSNPQINKEVDPPQLSPTDNPLVTIQDATFQWDVLPPDRTLTAKKKKSKMKWMRKQWNSAICTEQPLPSKPFSLEEINLRIPTGSLVAIVGKSGSGKSSLMAALLGEMRLVRGQRKINKECTIGYCQQNTWVMTGTIRDNVLFGLPFDEERYHKVLAECALDQDLQSFPQGDLTLIGEKGATVSGGQRQRIGLARIAYAQPAIALLDDPLSAVDAAVANCLFYDCIKQGSLQGTTRILSTHHTSFLSDVDYIVVLDQGRILATGTLLEIQRLLVGREADFGELLAQSPLLSRRCTQPCLENPCREMASTPVPSTSTNNTSTATISAKYTERISKNASRLAVRSYLEAFGGLGSAMLLVALVVGGEALRVGKEVFLRSSLDNGITNAILFVLLYGGLGIGQGLLSVAYGLLGVLLCRRASRKIHDNCLQRILAAKLSIFETTPSGYIMNRFSRDMEMIDENFPNRINQLLTCLSAVISATLLLAVLYPIILPTILLPLGGTIWMQQRFRRAWRQLQQLSNVTLGPILSHYTVSLSGLSTIRAFGQQRLFTELFDRFNDHYCYAAICLMGVRRWASLRSETLWTAYLYSLLLICIALKVSASITGLVLLYVTNAVESVDWSMRQLAEVESCFVSVERLHQYVMGLDTEADGGEIKEGEKCENDANTMAESTIISIDVMIERQPNDQAEGGTTLSGEDTKIPRQMVMPKDWPTKGHVLFRNVCISYPLGTQAAVTDFCYDIAPRKRIAIVGRSGAGKSTIVAALFRFTSLSQGAIEIDGIDIRNISLRRLRQSLAMVPQDPVLFCASLRANLDPDNRCSDEQIWRALEDTKMSGIISAHTKRLEMEIDEAGGNFSVGQRQLLCLARAVLRKSPIIVMDEATSNLDRETEALMQTSMQATFAGCTVITIAHRLETILDHDEVIVMGSGRILEAGSPQQLASRPGSDFARMLKSAGMDSTRLARSPKI